MGAVGIVQETGGMQVLSSIMRNESYRVLGDSFLAVFIGTAEVV